MGRTTWHIALGAATVGNCAPLHRLRLPPMGTVPLLSPPSIPSHILPSQSLIPPSMQFCSIESMGKYPMASSFAAPPCWFPSLARNSCSPENILILGDNHRTIIKSCGCFHNYICSLVPDNNYKYGSQANIQSIVLDHQPIVSDH